MDIAVHVTCKYRGGGGDPQDPPYFFFYCNVDLIMHVNMLSHTLTQVYKYENMHLTQFLCACESNS